MRMLAAALLFGVAARLGAQEASTDTAQTAAQGYAPMPQGSAPAAVVSQAKAGSIVLPTRSDAQLEEAMSASQADLRRSDARLSRAKEIEFRSKALVDQRRLDLREVEVKIEQAKKEKRDSDKRRLESEKKALEREKRWAEQLESADQAELDAARQACLTGFARQQSVDLEQRLAQARSGKNQVGGGKPLSKENSEVLVRQLEQQTLESQLKYRKLAHELARQEEALVGERLDLYKSARQ
ncbi:MAG: hypothetical protein ACJ8AX_15050 [Gemmatimonadales bacterium]